jgi:hypothetical protein
LCHQLAQHFPNSVITGYEPKPWPSVTYESNAIVTFTQDTPKGDYDLVILSHVLHHVADPLITIKAAAERMAALGSYVILIEHDLSEQNLPDIQLAHQGYNDDMPILSLKSKVEWVKLFQSVRLFERASANQKGPQAVFGATFGLPRLGKANTPDISKKSQPGKKLPAKPIQSKESTPVVASTSSPNSKVKEAEKIVPQKPQAPKGKTDAPAQQQRKRNKKPVKLKPSSTPPSAGGK